MPKLKKIAAGVAVGVVLAGGVATTITSTPEEKALKDQITEIELLIEQRTAAGESTTMQVQKLQELKLRLNEQ